MMPPVSRDVDLETFTFHYTCLMVMLMVWVLSTGEPRVVGQTACGVEVPGWETQLARTRCLHRAEFVSDGGVKLRESRVGG